jgi:hypothetical protein
LKRAWTIILIALLLSSLLVGLSLQTGKAANPYTIFWTKTYGAPPNETADAVVQTIDGGYSIAGSNNSYTGSNFPNGSNAFLTKTDSTGNQLWTKTYRLGGLQLGVSSVIQTSDKGYALAYSVQNPVSGNAYLVKTDLAGNQLWLDESTVSTCFVVQTSDGGFVWGGTSGIPSLQQPYYIWLNKTDSAGNQIWGKTYGNGNQAIAYSIVQTTDGGYAIAGLQAAGTALLIKTDSAGNEIWGKTYPSFYGFCASLVQTSGGGYSVVAYKIVAGNADYYLVKLDSSGNLQWSQPFGFSIRSLVQTNDGGYLICGSNTLLKVDSSGNVQWTQTFAGVSLSSLIATNDGNYAVAGTYSDAVNTYSWLSKISINSAPQYLGYYITSYPDGTILPSETANIGEPYEVVVEIHNSDTVSHTWTIGLNVGSISNEYGAPNWNWPSYLIDVMSALGAPAQWDVQPQCQVISSGQWQSYQALPTTEYVTETVPAGQTVNFVFPLTSFWYWIPPWNAEYLLASAIWGIVGGYFTGVKAISNSVNLLNVVEAFGSAQIIVLNEQFNFQVLYGSTILGTGDALVTVPHGSLANLSPKIDEYIGSVVASAAAGASSAFAILIPPLLVPLVLAQIGLIAAQNGIYIAATDPSSDYNQIVEPVPFTLNNGTEFKQLSAINSLSGSNYDLAQTIGNLLEFQNATTQSITRYAEAKSVNDGHLESVQLQAATTYACQRDQLITQFSNQLSALSTQLPLLNATSIANAETYLTSNGLPQMEQQLLPQMNLSTLDITTSLEVLLNAANLNDTILNAVSLTDGIQGTQSMLQPETNSINQLAASSVSNITINPADPGVVSGNSINFTATANDIYGDIWDVTSFANWTINTDAGGSWVGNTYNSGNPGTWVITAQDAEATGTTEITVTPLPTPTSTSQSNASSSSSPTQTAPPTSTPTSSHSPSSSSSPSPSIPEFPSQIGVIAFLLVILTAIAIPVIKKKRFPNQKSERV